jgi:hypothetical protein
MRQGCTALWCTPFLPSCYGRHVLSGRITMLPWKRVAARIEAGFDALKARLGAYL